MNETVITKHPPSFAAFLRTLFAYRELFFFFLRRDLTVRYRRSLLGIFWIIVKPLLAVGILTVVYRSLGGQSIDGVPYAVYVFLALLFWNGFATGMQGAVDSLAAEEALLKKVYFPRILVPSSVLASTVIDFVFGLGVFAALMVLTGIPVHAYAVASIALIFIPFFLFTCGMSYLLTLANVYTRDISRLLPYCLQLLFFATPIIYSTRLFATSSVLAFNPLGIFVETARDAAFFSHSFVHPAFFILSCASIFFFCAGVVAFYLLDRHIADAL